MLLKAAPPADQSAAGSVNRWAGPEGAPRAAGEQVFFLRPLQYVMFCRTGPVTQRVGMDQCQVIIRIKMQNQNQWFSSVFGPSNQQLVPDGPARSLLTATVGPRVLTRLDDGSGGTSPERVAALWAEAGIRNSQQILQ
ncbi:hypothetical protein CCH79_00020603, partial [Gambusia affinis]